MEVDDVPEGQLDPEQETDVTEEDKILVDRHQLKTGKDAVQYWNSALEKVSIKFRIYFLNY